MLDTQQAALTADARYLTAKWRRDNAPLPTPKRTDPLTDMLEGIIRFPGRWKRNPENLDKPARSNMCDRCERLRVATAVELLALWRANHVDTPLGVAGVCWEKWVADIVELLGLTNPSRLYCGHHGGDAYTGYRAPTKRPAHIAVVLAAENNGITVPDELQTPLDKLALLHRPKVQASDQLKEYRIGVAQVRKALREIVEMEKDRRPKHIWLGAKLTGKRPKGFKVPAHVGPWFDSWDIERAHRLAVANWTLTTQDPDGTDPQLAAVRKQAKEDLLKELQEGLPVATALLSDETGLELDPARVYRETEWVQYQPVITQPGKDVIDDWFERSRWDTSQADAHVQAHIATLRRCRDDLRSEELAAIDEARHLGEGGSIVAMPYREYADKDDFRKSAFGDGFEDEALIPDRSLTGLVFDKQVYEAEQFDDPLSDRVFAHGELDDDQQDNHGAGSVIHDTEAGMAYGAFNITIAPFLDPIETDAARSKYSYRTTYEDMDADRGAPGLWYDLPEPSRIAWRDVPRPLRRRRKGSSEAEQKRITLAWFAALDEWRAAGKPEFVAYVRNTLATLERRIGELEAWLRDPSGPDGLAALPFDEWLQAIDYRVSIKEVEAEAIEGDDYLDVQAEEDVI